MKTALETIAGGGGFIIVSNTAAQTDNFSSIVVLSDAVFSAFSINGATALVVKGMSGVTIPAGAYLPAGLENTITAFTLASGTVIAYK